MTSQDDEQETSAVGSGYEHDRRSSPPGLVDSAVLFARSAQLTWARCVCCSARRHATCGIGWSKQASNGRTNIRACPSIARGVDERCAIGSASH
jgi:hypothetical protein